MDGAGWLGSLESRLHGASPVVASLVEKLVSADAVERMRGLDAVAHVVLEHGALREGAPEALTHLLALATCPAYPATSPLLARLLAIVGSIDDPPRAGPGADRLAQAAHRAYAASLPRLIHHARTARDPAAARIAALLAARFPDVDAEVEPLLVALLSGTADPDERARLFYALARIQATRGVPFHPRIADAMHRTTVDAETIAVALALAEHDPPAPLRARLAAILRSAGRGASDPRSWGRTLRAGVLERALAQLA